MSSSNLPFSEEKIFKMLREGKSIAMDDPDYSQISKAAAEMRKLVTRLNQAEDKDEIREILSAIIGAELDEKTNVFTPFYTNLGINIKLGKNVFINHACSFLDIGGITIEDNVMIGPRVNITSEGHPIDPLERKTMVPAAVTVKENAWIGAAATILPGVTIGVNSVVAAGAVVTQDVPDNVVVAGVPARIIKHLAP
ncbi:sugar O-acetyltransferase [Fulvivirga ligni]|uniref:sugar O-acetyltransferase n=1 Tax=Fulvivirga ligni TaxID=2904246 RepID=UPI001F2DD0D3|nr:sugar O-acetyltransferase [Fulvivirga ligni]UII24039.1 sugar O-acetyltransferase [Fulvivirga ligni]